MSKTPPTRPKKPSKPQTSGQPARSPHPSGDALGFRSFAAMARVEIDLPVDAHVVGEPVTVTEIHYPDLPRAGLLATCRRADRSHQVSFADLVFAPGSPGASVAARYREWIGLSADGSAPQPAHPPKITSDDIVIGKPVELVVLACKSNAIRCRLLGTSREVTLRTAVRDEVPGSIVTVTPAKHWTHARHPYVSGDVDGTRFDVHALGLAPLALHQKGDWNPDDEYWGQQDEPIDDWARPIIARGKRPMFELEQVIPGVDPDDFDSDPILEAAELHQAGDVGSAYAVLMNLLAQDLRCLDAHAHLGNLEFERSPEQAILHYEMGTLIGGALAGEVLRRRLAVGPHRQPPLPPLPARHGPVRVAARRPVRRHVGVHEDAVAQSWRQPGRALQPRRRRSRQDVDGDAGRRGMTTAGVSPFERAMCECTREVAPGNRVTGRTVSSGRRWSSTNRPPRAIYVTRSTSDITAR